MSVALDLGSHASRSLRVGQDDILRRQSRTMALLLEDGAATRSRLRQFEIPFIPCDDRLAVPGNPAADLAQVFSIACQDLLPDGQVPFADPVTRQLIAALIESLLPAAPQEGTICCFTQPGHGRDDDAGEAHLDRRREFVSRVIHLRGYDPLPINPALALILAEMEPEQFTGVGVCLGASGCELVLAHRGMAISSLRIPRGGRSIDELLAAHSRRICIDSFGQSVLDLEWARRSREEWSSGSLTDDQKQLIERAVNDLVLEIVLGLQRLLVNRVKRFSEPLTMVLGGGMAQSPAFELRFRKQVARTLPALRDSHIRLASDAGSGVARGCLVQALLEGQSNTERRLARVA